MVRPEAEHSDVRLLTRRLTLGLAGYVVLIVLGPFLPLVAVFRYVAIALILTLPVRRRSGWRRQAWPQVRTGPRSE